MCTIQNVNVSTLVFCDMEAKVRSTEEGKCCLKVNSQYNACQLMVSCLTYDIDVPLTLYFINISPPPSSFHYPVAASLIHDRTATKFLLNKQIQERDSALLFGNAAEQSHVMRREYIVQGKVQGPSRRGSFLILIQVDWIRYA